MNISDSNRPLGYNVVDGKLVPNEAEAELVKWAYKADEEYANHPPKVLVEAVLEEHEGEGFTYEEAEKLVLRSTIDTYLNAEFHARWSLFSRTAEEQTGAAMLEILALPYEEVKEQLSKLPKPADYVGHIADLPMLHTRNAADHAPIIAQEDFDAVQKLLRQGK